MTPRSLAFDLLIGAAAFAILALLPTVWPSKALIDFVIRGSALALFATSLNMLVGYGGMVSLACVLPRRIPMHEISREAAPKVNRKAIAMGAAVDSARASVQHIATMAGTRSG